MSYMIPGSDDQLGGVYSFSWKVIGGEQFDPADPRADLGEDPSYHVHDLTGIMHFRRGNHSEDVGGLYASVLHLGDATPMADEYTRPDISDIVKHHQRALRDFCHYAFTTSGRLKNKIARALRHPDNVKDACIDRLLLIDRVAVKPEHQQHQLHLHLVTSFLRHFRGSVWDLVAIAPRRPGDEEAPTNRAPWSTLGFTPLPGSNVVAFPLEGKLPTHRLVSQRLQSAAVAAA